MSALMCEYLAKKLSKRRNLLVDLNVERTMLKCVFKKQNAKLEMDKLKKTP
jgi:hypothetical protein